MARHGLPTAARLLDLVVDELTSVCSELAEEADLHRDWSQHARSSVAAELAVSGKIPAHHPAVEQAVHTGPVDDGRLSR